MDTKDSTTHIRKKKVFITVLLLIGLALILGWFIIDKIQKNNAISQINAISIKYETSENPVEIIKAVKDIYKISEHAKLPTDIYVGKLKSQFNSIEWPYFIRVDLAVKDAGATYSDIEYLANLKSQENGFAYDICSEFAGLDFHSDTEESRSLRCAVDLLDPTFHTGNLNLKLDEYHKNAIRSMNLIDNAKSLHDSLHTDVDFLSNEFVDHIRFCKQYPMPHQIDFKSRVLVNSIISYLRDISKNYMYIDLAFWNAVVNATQKKLLIPIEEIRFWVMPIAQRIKNEGPPTNEVIRGKKTN